MSDWIEACILSVLNGEENGVLKTDVIKSVAAMGPSRRDARRVLNKGVGNLWLFRKAERNSTFVMLLGRPSHTAPKPASPTTPSAADTLRRAADLIEQRGKQRDSDTGERSMARTVAAFNAIYGTNLTETQGWHFMELMKMARSSQGVYVADDFDDKVAYAALAAECEAGARGRTD